MLFNFKDGLGPVLFWRLLVQVAMAHRAGRRFAPCLFVLLLEDGKAAGLCQGEEWSLLRKGPLRIFLFGMGKERRESVLKRWMAKKCFNGMEKKQWLMIEKKSSYRDGVAPIARDCAKTEATLLFLLLGLRTACEGSGKRDGRFIRLGKGGVRRKVGN